MTILTSAALPTRGEMWHDEATVQVGNALAVVLDSNQINNMYIYQNAAANGDTFTNSCFLRAGTYTLSIIGQTANDQGIVDWYLDGGLIVNGQDWYSAGTTRNVIKTASGLVIPDDGYHILKGSINGKNGASSNYFLRLNKYWFKQAAD